MGWEVIANMASGRTAMTIHHLGSAAQLEEALGQISAAPVPKGTKGYWTSFGDEENAVFAAAKSRMPLSNGRLSCKAENNAIWQKSSGQVSINKSNASADADRFLKATT